jgi:molybdopterin/thiamine biosynthesis adenylyltransferase
MKRITVIGVGALGSHFVQFARNLRVQFKIVDFDRVEQKNTMSQFHAKTSVGKGKVLGLGQLTNLLWGMKLSTIPHKLTVENDKQILGESDLVVDCLDNGAARRIVQSYVRANKIPCVHGALAADAGFGRVVWDESFVIDDEPAEGVPTCEDGQHLPFITLVSGYLARSVQAFIHDESRIGYQINPKGAFSF